MVDIIGWPRFRFIGMSVVGVGLGEAKGLAISGAISTRADVAVSFSGLSMW